jgi:hypothetical protein
MEKVAQWGASYFVLIPNIIRQVKSRRMRGARLVICVGEKRKVYKVLVGKPEGKRPHRRLRHR